LYYQKNNFTYVDSGRIQKTDPQLFVSRGGPCKEKTKCSNEMYRLIHYSQFRNSEIKLVWNDVWI